jgi:hypothetical protein
MSPSETGICKSEFRAKQPKKKPAKKTPVATPNFPSTQTNKKTPWQRKQHLFFERKTKMTGECRGRSIQFGQQQKKKTIKIVSMRYDFVEA